MSAALLAGVVIAVGIVVRVAVSTGGGYLDQDGDLYEWRLATHRALTHGLHSVYEVNLRNDPALTGQEWSGGYFVNTPPVLLYLRSAAALAYRTLDREGFELWDSRLDFHELEASGLSERLARSRGFTLALKLPGILADALIALGLYGARRGHSAGAVAAAAYALNPAVVYNTAFWGQADAVWIVLVALGLVALERERPAAAASAATLALLTKPQALAFLPLLGVLIVAQVRRRILAPALAALLTFLLVFSPFLWAGTFAVTIEALWRSTLGGEPFLSCNAANLWLLLDGGQGFGTSDATPLLGPLSARSLGALVFLAAALVIARQVPPGGAAGLPRLWLAAATTSLAFFAFGTELHENHLIAVLPFLALAAGAAPQLWPVLALLSLTNLANLVLFDEAALARLGWTGSVRAAALALAIAHTLALPVVWWIYRRGRPPG